MKPSRLIFAFLLGGIVIATCAGRVGLAILLAMFLMFLIVISLLAGAFRNESTEPRLPGANPPEDRAPRD
ncbi:MAG: hypothetical protein JWN51_2854 [Phycisphaerales bacterium]|jgi:hypothetical protein|nr:hypothetical protein [Phycisphaerales bacterium]